MKLFLPGSGLLLFCFLLLQGCAHERDTVTRHPSIPESKKLRLSKEERTYVRTDAEGREYYMPPSRVIEPKKR